MKFSTKGPLSESTFIEILKDAAQSSLTGMVRLENGPTVKVVYFQKGTISFASSNEKTDRLTEVLQRAGKLTAEQVADAQARLKPNVSLGKTLVELGYISAKDLLWGAREQVDGILHQLLFWNQGKYQLMQGTLPREIIHLNLQVASVIFTGIMKSQDRDWILRRIGSPEAIYELTSHFEELNEKLNLSVSEVTSKLNGKRSLHEIAQGSGLDTFELCKTVVALEYLGLVQPVADKPLQMELNEVEAELFSMPLEDQPAPTEVDGARRSSQVPKLPIEEIPRITEQEKAAREKRTTGSPVFAAESVEHGQAETSPPSIDQKVTSRKPHKNENGKPEPVVKPIKPELAQIMKEPEEEIQYDSESPAIGSQSTFNWKRPIVILFLVWGIGLGAVFYFRTTRKSEVPLPSKTITPRKQPQETPGISESVKPAPQPEVSKPVEPPIAQSQPPLSTATVFENPLTLLRNGRLRDASRSWRNQIAKNRSGYSIQLVIACQEQTVMDTYRLLDYSREIIVLPVTFKGQNCYRVLFGKYPSRELAQASVQKLPDIFVRQTSPATVVALSRAL